MRFSISLISGIEKRARLRISAASALRDLSDRRHRLAGERFDLEPDFEFPLLGPEFAHRRAGITIDHRVNIEKRAARGKAIRGKKKRRSGERTAGATLALTYPKIL